MSVDSTWTIEAALAAFDDHLRRARGVCVGTRTNYARWVRAFLEERFPDGHVQVEELGARDVVAFISAASCRYQPRTLELVATSLRSFFRFLRTQGLGANGLEDAVPMVPHRRSGLVRHLDSQAFSELIASLDASSVRDLRDRAIILCMARLGLRVSEVCRLRLDDIDWRQGVVSVRTRKTGHGARLPIPAEVGHALAEYLEHGRPDTRARGVRAAAPAPRCSDQCQHRGTSGAKGARAGRDRGADPWREPSAPFDGHRAPGQRSSPGRDRRSARTQRARHHSDLCGSRCRCPS